MEGIEVLMEFNVPNNTALNIVFHIVKIWQDNNAGQYGPSLYDYLHIICDKYIRSLCDDDFKWVNYTPIHALIQLSMQSTLTNLTSKVTTVYVKKIHTHTDDVSFQYNTGV